jgi:hypothetical protein
MDIALETNFSGEDDMADLWQPSRDFVTAVTVLAGDKE